MLDYVYLELFQNTIFLVCAIYSPNYIKHIYFPIVVGFFFCRSFSSVSSAACDVKIWKCCLLVCLFVYIIEWRRLVIDANWIIATSMVKGEYINENVKCINHAYNIVYILIVQSKKHRNIACSSKWLCLPYCILMELAQHEHHSSHSLYQSICSPLHYLFLYFSLTFHSPFLVKCRKSTTSYQFALTPISHSDFE